MRIIPIEKSTALLTMRSSKRWKVVGITAGYLLEEGYMSVTVASREASDESAAV